MPQYSFNQKFEQNRFAMTEQPLYKVETYLAPSRRGALEWNVVRDAGSGIMTQSQLNYNADLTALVASNFTDFITGKKPLSEFDKFVEEFNNKGGKEWSEEITKLYNEKNAK